MLHSVLSPLVLGLAESHRDHRHEPEKDQAKSNTVELCPWELQI